MSRAHTVAASVVLASVVAGAAALGAVGCASKFDPASLVTEERLLAVTADPPEAIPGAAVTLLPYVVGPTGTLAPDDGFTAEWWRCPDEDSDSLGDFWQCGAPSQRAVVGTGVPYADVVPADLFGATAVAPVGEGEGEGESGDGAPAGLPGKALGALLGYWRVVGVTIRGVGNDRVVEGFKREPIFPPVPLSTLDERLAALDVRVAPEGGVAATNTNPVLQAVTVHEGAVDGPAVETLQKGGTYFFVPHYDARALQAYQSLKADLSGLPLDDAAAMSALPIDELLPRFEKVQRCEIPIFNWYVTAGRVRREVTLDEGVVTTVFDPRGVACPPVEGDPRTADTEFIAPSGTDDDPLPDDGVVHAWVVLRDGRGGTAVRAFDLPVE
jgi:hypothetical protein